MADKTEDFGDFILPFQIEDLGLHGRLVRLGGSLEQAFARHDYPAVVSDVLGQAMALSTALSASIKYDGIFTLQAQGDGPVGMLMSDVTSDGDLRGYVRFDDEHLSKLDDASELSIPRLLGAGHMAFTVDQGADTERYQGIVELEGGNLAECAQNYFRQSEQLETALVVTAESSDANAPRAGALMIQRLPADAEGTYTRDEEDEAWRRAVVLMSSVTPAEILDPALSPNELLYRLYHEDGVRVFREKPIRHQCRCSKDKVSRTLASFPIAEISEMADDGIASVVCEFCKTEYTFPLSDIERILDDVKAKATES